MSCNTLALRTKLNSLFIKSKKNLDVFTKSLSEDFVKKEYDVYNTKPQDLIAISGSVKNAYEQRLARDGASIDEISSISNFQLAKAINKELKNLEENPPKQDPEKEEKPEEGAQDQEDNDSTGTEYNPWDGTLNPADISMSLQSNVTVEDIDLSELDSPDANTQTKFERIENLDKRRFNTMSDLHIKFQKFFSNEVFKSAIMNGNTVFPANVNKNIIEKLNSFIDDAINFYASNEEYESWLNRDAKIKEEYENEINEATKYTKPEIELKYKTQFARTLNVTNLDAKDNERVYNKLVAVLDFDYILKTYDTRNVIKKTDGKYQLLVTSKINDNIILSKDEINIDKEASDLYKFILENTNIVDTDGNNIEGSFLTNKLIGYFLPHVFRDSRWKNVNHVQEFKTIMSSLANDPNLSPADSIVARTLYKNFFSEDALKNKFGSNEKLLSALVTEMISIADNIPLQIKVDDVRKFQLVEGKLVSGSKNRLVDSVQNYLTANFIGDPNNVLKDLSAKGKISGGVAKNFEIRKTKTKFKISNQNDTSDDIPSELFNLLTGEVITTDMLDLAKKTLPEKDYRDFIKSIRQFSSNYGSLVVYLNSKYAANDTSENFSFSKFYAGSNEEIDEHLHKFIKASLGSNVRYDANIFSPVKIHGGQKVFETMQFLKDTLYQMSPKSTFSNSEGNQSARLNPANVLSQYHAVLNNFKATPNSLVKDTLFIKYENLFRRFYKFDGAITHFQGISHKNFGVKDNMDVAVNFLYFQKLNDSDLKNPEAFIQPTVYSDKSYDGVAAVKVTNPNITSESIEQSKTRHFETINSFVTNLENRILSDYNKALGIEADNLTGLNTQLTELYKNKTDFTDDIAQKFSDVGLEATEFIHYDAQVKGKDIETKGALKTSLLDKINSFKTRKAYDAYIEQQLANEVFLKEDVSFKLDRNVVEFVKNEELSGIKEDSVKKFLIDPDNEDLGYKIAIEENGEKVLHPAFVKWFYDQNLFSENLILTGFGFNYLDKGKTAAEQWIASTKRMNGPAAPSKKFTHGLENGIPLKGDEIVVKDPKIEQQFAERKDSMDITDGAAYYNMIHMRRRTNSLGGLYGMQAGVTHKDINHGIDYSTGFVSLDKRLTIPITNELIRQSKGDGERDFQKINKLLLSNPKHRFSVKFDQLTAEAYTTYAYNPVSGVLEKKMLDTEKTYTNMYEIWEDLGGENTIIFTDSNNSNFEAELDGETVYFKYAEFDSASAERQPFKAPNAEALTNVADIIVELESEYPEIKHRHTQALVYTSSRKRGNKNVNSNEKFKKALNGGEIATSKQSYQNLGIQFSTDKDFEDKQLTLSTQSIGAIALEGFDQASVENAYKALKELMKLGISTELETMLADNDSVKKLKNKAIEIIEASVKSTEIGSIANQIYEYANKELDGNVPFDHPQIYKMVVATLNSFITGESIRQKLAGSQLVLLPPVKIVRIGGEAMLLDDFYYKVKTNDKKVFTYLKSKGGVGETALQMYESLINSNPEFLTDLKDNGELEGAKLFLYNSEGSPVEYDKEGSPIYEDMLQFRTATGKKKGELRNKINKYLQNQQELVASSKNNVYYDKDGNALYKSIPGEVIAPFINVNKYAKYGVKKGMSLSQVRSKLESAPSNVKRDFEIQLLSTNERIPLQSLASMMTNKTIGFLHNFKTSAMVNHLHQQLTGGDFDVDKTNHSVFEVYGSKKKHIKQKGKEGNIIPWKKSFTNDFSDWNANIEEVVEQINTYKNKDEKQAALRNYLLYLKINTTLKPATQIVRNTPVSINTIEKLKLLRNFGSDPKLLFGENVPSSIAHIKYANQSAKSVVGIAATAIKVLAVIHFGYHKAFKELNNDTFTEASKDELLGILKIPALKLPDGTIYERVADLNFNVFENNRDGLFSVLNALENIEGDSEASIEEKIQKTLDKYVTDVTQYDFLGELLNAAVDNAKELALSVINSGTLTARMYVTMSLMGVEPSKIGEIMIQPEVDLAIKIAEKSFRKDENMLFKDAVETILNNPLAEDEDTKIYDENGNFEIVESDDKKALELNKVVSKEKEELKKEKTKPTKRALATKLLAQLNAAKLTKSDYNANYKYISENFDTIALDDKTYDVLNNAIAAAKKSKNKNRRSYLIYIKGLLTSYKKYLEVNEEISDLGDRDLEAAKENLAFIVEVDDLSQGMNILSNALGINQGLGSTEYKIFNLKNKIEEHYGKVVGKLSSENRNGPASLDFFRFIKDPIYREQIISTYNKAKPSVNIFYMLAESPHFMESYNSLVNASKWGEAISFKLKTLDSLVNYFHEKGIIKRNSLKEEDFNRFIKMLDEIAITDYYANNSFNVETIPAMIVSKRGGFFVRKRMKESIDLSNSVDRQLFVEFMDNYIIPTLKAKAPNNHFLRSLVKSNSKPDGFGEVHPVHRLVFDPNAMTSDTQITQQMLYREGLEQLDTNVMTTVKQDGKTHTMVFNPFEYLVHYNRIVNNDSMSSQSFTRYLPDKQIVKDYWKYLSNYSTDINNIFSDNLTVADNVLTYLATKYNLIRYIPPAKLRSMQNDSENGFSSWMPTIYKTREKNKMVVYKRGKRLSLDKRYINFGNNYDGSIFFEKYQAKTNKDDAIDFIIRQIKEC